MAFKAICTKTDVIDLSREDYIQEGLVYQFLKINY